MIISIPNNLEKQEEQIVIDKIKYFIEDIYTIDEKKRIFIELRNSIIMGIYVVAIARDNSIEYKVCVAYDRDQLPETSDPNENEEFFAIALQKLTELTSRHTHLDETGTVEFIAVDFSYMTILINGFFHPKRGKNLDESNELSAYQKDITKLAYLANGYIIYAPNNNLETIQNKSKAITQVSQIAIPFIPLDALILKLIQQIGIKRVKRSPKYKK